MLTPEATTRTKAGTKLGRPLKRPASGSEARELCPRTSTRGHPVQRPQSRMR
jgi:hypothetical protein